MAEIYRRQVEELAALLQTEDDKQEAFEAIRGLVDQIILSPEEDKLRVDLHGEIAAILKLAQAGKNPARDLADRAEQLVMVAGVGFERRQSVPGDHLQDVQPGRDVGAAS